MTRRRWATIALAGLAALTFTTAACTSKSADKPAPGVAAGNVALDDLKAAAAKTAGQAFKYTVAVGTLLSGSGTQDSTGKNASLNLDASAATTGLKLKASVLMISPDVYLKFDFGALNGTIPGLGPVGSKWMHANPSKIASGSAFGIKPGTDVISPKALLSGAATATRSGSNFTGTIDASKTGLPFLSSQGVKGKDIPFTATLDSAGRVAKITISPPATETPTGTLTVTYSDFGTTVTLARPAASDTVQAPDMIYQFLQ